MSIVPEGKDYRLSSNDANDGPLKFVLPGGKTNLEGKVNILVHFCGVCNQEMKSINDLVEHAQLEHDGMRYKCDNCDYKCKQPFQLAGHRLARHHLETEGFKILECEFAEEEGCSYKCIDPYLLQNHVNGVHKKLRNFKCGVCDKDFTQKASLKTHMDQVHVKLKNYVILVSHYFSI